MFGSEGFIGHLQARNCFTFPPTPPGMTTFVIPDPGVSIATQKTLVSACSNWGKFDLRLGHTRGTNDGVHDSGVTTVVPPNIMVTVPGLTGPFDRVSIDETNGGPIHPSPSASRYHLGGMDALFSDGSVRFIKNTISQITWRVLGSIAGGEVISADSFRA